MRYNPALDGIRGLAVLSVLFFHVQQQIPAPAAGVERMLFRLSAMGWSGVDLFFVLSGYLITNILLTMRNGSFGQYCKAFYARRALRIFPLYFVVVPSILIMLQLFGPVRPAWSDWLIQLTYTQNTIGLYFDSQVSAFLGHTWSLAIEEWFYLTWPFLVFFLSPRALRRTALFGIIVILALRLVLQKMDPAPPLYANSITHFDTILVGALLALSSSSHRMRRIWMGAGALAFLCSVVIRMTTHDLAWVAEFNAGVGLTLVAFGAAALVISCSYRQSRIGRVFAWGPLCRIGKISYGIYLLHLPILVLIARATSPWTAGFSYVTRFTLLILPVAFITVGLAALSFTYFETRLLKLKSKFDYGRVGSEPGPATASIAS